MGGTLGVSTVRRGGGRDPGLTVAAVRGERKGHRLEAKVK